VKKIRAALLSSPTLTKRGAELAALVHDDVTAEECARRGQLADLLREIGRELVKMGGAS